MVTNTADAGGNDFRFKLKDILLGTGVAILVLNGL